MSIALKQRSSDTSFRSFAGEIARETYLSHDSVQLNDRVIPLKPINFYNRNVRCGSFLDFHEMKCLIVLMRLGYQAIFPDKSFEPELFEASLRWYEK